MDGIIRKLIDAMTLEEKAALCSGLNFWYTKPIERLGVPSLCVSDGPHGLRKHAPGKENAGLPQSVPATCFPTASAMANSWDTQLMRRIGEALGEECLAEHVDVLLGPGVNIKRSPLCGRNFEYFSEDPYLTGELAAAFIEGVQSKGVGTSLKHYAVNNQETLRLTIDAIVDERALREIYLPGFEKAVKRSKPWTVMCAYNSLNGTYCSEYKKLLTSILRDEWGYEGMVVSDWGAVNDRVQGLKAGLDLEMPGNGGVNDERIIAAVKDGTLDISALDTAVARIVSLIVKASNHRQKEYRYDRDAHHALAREAAAQSAVLLKNEDHTLSIKKDARIALIGAFAQNPRYQGNGSSLVNPTRLETAYDAFKARNMDFTYSPGYGMDTDKPNPNLIEEAVRSAREADAAVVFAGLPRDYESEGFDRIHMDMPASHNELINAVADANPRTVVVLQNGAPVAMPWIDSVKAVLACCLAGQAGGPAAVDVLTGDVNPSGKLAETYPIHLSNTPCYRYFPEGPRTVEYRESVYVGYRYYEAAKKEVLFPFGHGLSYTEFTYRDMKLSADRIRDNESLEVSVTIENTGDVAGAEVVQLYVRDEESTVFRPEKELKGFAKVYLEPGEQKTVSFTLDKRAFAYYHTGISDWHVESGTFAILAGSSSARIHLTGRVYVEPTRPEVTPPDYRANAPTYYQLPDGEFTVPDDEFVALLGRPLPEKQRRTDTPFTANSTMEELKRRWIGRILYRIVRREARKLLLSAKADPTAMRMVEQTVSDMPLRNLVVNSDGAFTYRMMDALILILNRKCIQGIRTLLSKKRSS